MKCNYHDSSVGKTYDKWCKLFLALRACELVRAGCHMIFAEAPYVSSQILGRSCESIMLYGTK